ncbi:MAG: transporter [Alphaproteobacteria bacterium]|nr:transporter [Alphaproteobacteria bacterium]
MNKILTLTALGTVLLCANAQAAGFHLREQSAAAQGNAFAGATAGAENNTYAYFNVAGLTRQKGTQFNIGGTYIAPKASAKDVKYVGGQNDGERGPDINNIVHAAVAPNMTYSHQIDDKTYVGMSLNVPYGMVTKYDNKWAGSDHGITSKVTSVTVTPMAAYKVNDKLSLGAGLQMQYIKAKLSNSANSYMVDKTRLEGDTFDIGYQLGALYEFDDDTRVGLAYRSQIKHKLKGEIEASATPIPGQTGGMINALLNQDISARLTTPDMLSLGVFHQVNDKWAVMAEYQRVFWSSFENLTIKGTSLNQSDLGIGGSYISDVKENWRDTNFYAVGANYKIDDQWTWRLGLAYDQAAARYANRTPRIPDSDRLWYSTGLSYKYNDKLTFDLAYTYIYAHKAKMNSEVTGNKGAHASADFSNSVQLFGFSLNYNF